MHGQFVTAYTVRQKRVHDARIPVVVMKVGTYRMREFEVSDSKQAPKAKLADSYYG